MAGSRNRRHHNRQFISPPAITQTTMRSLHTGTRQVTICLTADIGGQYGLLKIKIMYRLSFSKLNLIPVNTKTSTMNPDVITILKEAILSLSGKSRSGNVLERAQVCFVNDVIETSYLRLEACAALGRHRETSRSSSQPLSNPRYLPQLHQAHPNWSATAPVPYAPSCHHYQLLYISQQLTPTDTLSRIGY